MGFKSTVQTSREAALWSLRLISAVEAVPDWPRFKPEDGVTLGQVAGVGVDSRGVVHIFHRGPRKWEGEYVDITQSQHESFVPMTCHVTRKMRVAYCLVFTTRAGFSSTNQVLRVVFCSFVLSSSKLYFVASVSCLWIESCFVGFSSFDMNDKFKGTDAIAVNTVISIDRDGNVVNQWGANM